MSLDSTPLGRAREGLDSCVHCGFCLPACPTYLALEDENDSPRGRLVLMGALLDGTVAVDDPVVREHLDRCLGCRGCETACPSGVPYGHLLEAARETLVAVRPLPWVGRLVLAILARPRLLFAALAVARLVRVSGLARLGARVLPRRLAMPFAMLASTARAAPRPWTPTSDGARGTATLLTGCVMEGLFAGVNRATERTLTVNGWRMRTTVAQRCCGALHAHAGEAETARALARANIAAFDASGADVVVMNSAGCGAMCKEYGRLLGDDPLWASRAQGFASRVRDVHELLAEAGPLPAATLADEDSRPRVAYDAPCHLQHAQKVVTPPLAVLAASRQVRLVPLADSDQCCGSAGIFNLVQPGVAERVLAPKLATITASGAQVVATGNPGCLMQIGGGLVLDRGTAVTRHPVELLDDGYARTRAPG